MSDKKHWPRAEALKVAEELAAVLKPHCNRIEVAGSLRRGKAEVGDVEIVMVPKAIRERDPKDLFSVAEIDLADRAVEAMVQGAVLSKRPSKVGMFTWGSRNKLAVHVESGIPVDLFSTTEENWFTTLVIRTGGKAQNLLLTTGAQRLGRKLHAYGAGVEWPDGIVNRCNREEDVFEFCGVNYLKPEDRP